MNIVLRLDGLIEGLYSACESISIRFGAECAHIFHGDPFVDLHGISIDLIPFVEGYVVHGKKNNNYKGKSVNPTQFIH